MQHQPCHMALYFLTSC